MDSKLIDGNDASAQPAQDTPKVIVVGKGSGSMRLGEAPLDVIMQMPLPGIVIFVHGVNSDGEWFQAAEQGLCKGLNTRLARNDGQLAYPSVEGGQLAPVGYAPDLTPDGYLNPKKDSNSFINDSPQFSPVIHFRWGYKASAADLQLYGDTIYLNEQNYWGGGPFANGCTSIPDLWESGVDDQLFLWLHAQHMNPTNDRLVYACPHRGYYVAAALRLAKLIGEIRKKQADVPVTIVCHSQGNIVSMAAAFLGDRLGQVTDGAGNAGHCVANAYVLCNPPYSLLKSNIMEAYSELGMGNGETGRGRQTYEARIGTLKNFFEIMRNQAKAQDALEIDIASANAPHGFTAQKDRESHGYGPGKTSHGRVTLYFNPHDQVISSTTIQGIGWRGMNADEIRDANGGGVFCQRVFSQGFPVGGAATKYDAWNDHHVKAKDGSNLKPGDKQFWYPESPRARYSIKKGLDANEHYVAKAMTLATAPVFYLVTALKDVRINGLPDKGWVTPLEAPALVPPFLPQARRFGQLSDQFDEGIDAPGSSRNKDRQRDAGDPYAGERKLESDPRDPADAPRTDAARGDEDTEASLRYEHHALLRMRAKRDGLHVDSDPNGKRYGKADDVKEEDDLSIASDGYRNWRAEQIKNALAENVGSRATDHSSIMTNPDHAEKALAYDIPVGVCHIAKEDLAEVRVMADWRYLEGLGKSHPLSPFVNYFKLGTMAGQEMSKWANDERNAEAALPPKVVNKRSLIAKG